MPIIAIEKYNLVIFDEGRVCYEGEIHRVWKRGALKIRRFTSVGKHTTVSGICTGVGSQNGKGSILNGVARNNINIVILQILIVKDALFHFRCKVGSDLHLDVLRCPGGGNQESLDKSGLKGIRHCVGVTDLMIF